VGACAAHLAGFSFDDNIFKATSLKYATISIVHYPVSFFEAFAVGVEAVGIFHNKFARPENTKPRTKLIAILKAYLINIHRKLFV